MSEVTIAYFAVFFLSLLLCFFLVPLMQRLSFTFNIVDVPGGRKAHQTPIPCLGGVAVYLSFMIVVVGGLVAFYFWTRFQTGQELVPLLVKQIPLLKNVSPKLFSLLGGATVILAVGLVDDIVGVKFDYRLKFAAEILVALWMVLAGIRLDLFGSPLLNGLVTIFWIVGITNAFNLLDNMDGLCAGVAYICSMLFFIVAARHDQFFVGLIYLTFAGSILAFLYFNSHPARIFLGDTGALFIGFILATLTVLQTYETPGSQSLLPAFMPIVILSLPIFDTTRVVLIRLYERRPIFQGDRRHLSHRFVEMGMNPRRAVLTVYGITFALGIGCIALDNADLFTSWVILLQAASVAVMISLIMAFTKK